MTFITIVTVVRNDRAGLQRTCDSIARQGSADFEWWVVDGASTDGTAQLAQALQAQFTRGNVISEPDRGLYDAMNKGLRAARGDYILFLNAGDQFAGPDVLERIADALRGSDTDILWGSSIMQFGSKEVHRPVKPPNYVDHGQPGLHQATVFRTTLHQRFEYDPDFGITSDYRALCRMIAAGARTGSEDILISINEFTPKSKSNRFKAAMVRECFATQRDILRLPLRRRLASAARRVINSIAAKTLTLTLDRSGR